MIRNIKLIQLNKYRLHVYCGLQNPVVFLDLWCTVGGRTITDTNIRSSTTGGDGEHKVHNRL